MDRRLPASLMGLGLIMTLAGGAGVFAVFSDRATTGTNSITSGPRGQAVDLQIAPATVAAGVWDCGDFVDDLHAGLFSVTDAQPGGSWDSTFCLRNEGSVGVYLLATVVDRSDSETDCTGDEAVVDTTCGTGQGELGYVLRVRFERQDCATSEPKAASDHPFLDFIGDSVMIEGGSPQGLNPGDTACFGVTLTYPDDPGLPEEIAQVAQTDELVWRFAFIGSE